MFGLYKDSHMPYRFSEHVPARTKSSVRRGAPSKSIAQMYGLLFLSRPAITGSVKYGPNLGNKWK